MRDEQDRSIYDQTVRSEGVIKTSNYFVGRRLEKLALDEGIYDVSVTPLSDMSGIAPFRSELEFHYLTK